MNRTFHLVALGAFTFSAMSLAALTRLSTGCVSASVGVDTQCSNPGDCTTPYQCLPVTTDYTCSEDAGANTVMTCQLSCSSPGNCQQLSGNYTCSPSLSKCTAPNSEICVPVTTTQ